MSFAGTPLGQGRRLDHNAFLGKPQSSRLNSHTSYAYGAPALGSRSPPKPPRPEDQSEGALKLRRGTSHTSDNQSQPLEPEKWSVKDTSVNIAAAFHQAATDMQPNNAWASGTSRTQTQVPRSTSVEYESQSQSASARRLAAPPSRGNIRPPASRTNPKPLSKNTSLRSVPDSEGEEDTSADVSNRDSTPFGQVMGAAKRAIMPAANSVVYYARARSTEPDAPVSVNGSYDYSAEERVVQNLSTRSSASHKRNRMSTDNKAYKPSTSDLEESDEEFTDDDGKKKRKKKKKKEAGGGPLTTLPVAGYDKRRKKKRTAKGGNAEEEDEQGSGSDSQHTERQSIVKAPSLRRSVPPEYLEPVPDTSFEDAEQGLHSIPEVDEEDVRASAPPRSRSRSRSRAPSTGPRGSHFSIGAVLGKIIFSLFNIFGRVMGTVVDLILIRPLRWVANNPILQVLLIAAIAFVASQFVPNFGLRMPWGGSPVYQPSDVPASTIAEIAERLRRMELALSGLSLDSERTRAKLDDELRVQTELATKFGSLETRVEKESARTHEAENAARDATGHSLKTMKKDMETMQALLQAVQGQSQQPHAGTVTVEHDVEARAKLKILEDRVGSVEGGVRDAMDLAKKSATNPGSGSPASTGWWNKATGKGGMTIKSSDGQDVTALISDLVTNAVGLYGKDNLARKDFALYSSGAQVIPSLTSETYQLRPQSLRGKIVGTITGNGYLLGLPPVTALHYDIHDGHCWPIHGSSGKIGVKLAAPVHIQDFTIDHVAAENSINQRTSAPRDMEVWALVEGADNLAKLKEWRDERVARREMGENLEEEPVRPKDMPRYPEYIRIATFRYDVHAASNIQTFSMDEEIRGLEMDFGIVVLRVMNNWGHEHFTCLYRFRVHGQMRGDSPAVYPEDDLA
ncbi:unnamed protein product [Mycena citricolor]|uniref:SUN domain-containing protein n=1 Tax=Mycena citricolor TaxID=2018698 RepID=A0AAD2JY75_9AGAR|nr:unnamed protein product [Mycena citricolor]